MHTRTRKAFREYSAVEIENFIKNEKDPGNFRQESFNYEHQECGRGILKLTVLEKLPDGVDGRDARATGDKFKRLTVAYDYQGLGRGLNAFGE